MADCVESYLGDCCAPECVAPTVTEFITTGIYPNIFFPPIALHPETGHPVNGPRLQPGLWEFILAATDPSIAFGNSIAIYGRLLNEANGANGGVVIQIGDTTPNHSSTSRSTVPIAPTCLIINLSATNVFSGRINFDPVEITLRGRLIPNPAP